MNYIELTFTISENNEQKSEILIALLSELPFESFEQIPAGLKAFMPETDYDAEQTRNVLETIVLDDLKFETTHKLIPRENWNAEWEKHFFNPILIDDQCLIRSSFHQNTPRVPYEIIIDPKMSFGTGHHSTTTLMVKQVLKLNLEHKTVLDMGCGTGILAILAAMRHAKTVTAIDIDEWAYENTLENIVSNQTPHVQVAMGGAELLPGNKFDVILANINRNILLEDMATYVSCLNKGGLLIMSGFYQADIPAISNRAESLNLSFTEKDVLNEWSCTRFELKN